MSRAKSSTHLALVIKCQRYRESDLFVTLLTKQWGRVVVIAKGVRKLTSTKRSFLETGNLIKTHLIHTKGLPILTQTELLSSTHEIRTDLSALRKFLLFMEILDHLLVNEQLPTPLFQKILYLRELFLKKLGNHLIRPHCHHLLKQLGYTDDHSSAANITQQVTHITKRQLCSFTYLSLP
jgi:DNA repair protein RecO